MAKDIEFDKQERLDDLKNRSKLDKDEQFEIVYLKIKKYEPTIITIREADELYIFDDGKFIKLFKPTLKEMINRWDNLLLSTHNITVIRNMLSCDNIYSLTDFDADANIINLKNGLYNINEWQLGNGDLTHFIDHSKYENVTSGTRLPYLSFIQLPIKYDPQAENLLWDQFLTDIFGFDTVPDIYEMIAYFLMSHLKQQKCFLIKGIAGTGKTTFLDALNVFLGESNIEQIKLTDLKKDFRKYNLKGKLLNYYDDLEGIKLTNLSNWRQLVTNKKLSSNVKYIQEEMSWNNTTKQLYTCNFLPKLEKHYGNEFYDRWIIIDCPNLFRGTEIEDKDMGDKLIDPKELSGLLNEVLKAWKRLIERGKFREEFARTDQIKEIWSMDINPVKRFWDKYIIVDGVSHLDKYDFLELCNLDRVQQGFKPISIHMCTQSINNMENERVDTKKRIGTKTVYFGIKFKGDMDLALPEKKEEPEKLERQETLREHIESLPTKKEPSFLNGILKSTKKEI